MRGIFNVILLIMMAVAGLPSILVSSAQVSSHIIIDELKLTIHRNIKC